MKRLITGTLTYVVCSFVVQALSHFVVNAEHYASITFLRAEPIMALGITTMIVQGLILTYLYSFYQPSIHNPIIKGWSYGLLVGFFLVSYIALVEPSKYNAPSVIAWIAVEGLAGLVQFSLFGISLGLLQPFRQQSSTAG